MVFVLVDCNGLGIAYNDKMERITSDVLIIDVDTEVLHLQDDSGMILCTLLPNKAEYERNVNYDRRVQNCRNGFNVEYYSDSSSSCCCVKMSMSTKPMFDLRQWLTIAGTAILSLILGIFIGANVFQESKNTDNAEMEDSSIVVADSSNVADSVRPEASAENQQQSVPESQINNDEKVKGGIESREDSIKQEAQSLKQEVQSQMKNLQSMDCSMHTVEKAYKWWRGLSDNDKQIARSIYEFDMALIAYRKVFSITSDYDVRKVLDIGKHYFSKRQYIVLEKLARHPIDQRIRKKMACGLPFIEMERYINTIDYPKNSKK